MATNNDNYVRTLTVQELAELRRDMLEASEWMRAELRCRRTGKGPGAVGSWNPNLFPEGSSDDT